MKNIHVLPTEKSSRLFVYDGKLGLAKGFQYGSDAIQNHNIYITSDEEVKAGDWCLENSTKLLKWKMTYSFPSEMNDICKKIILTTDQDLIEDGVQAINDEFLEWFIKNPSCEYVEVKPLLSNNGRALFGYKMVIPKEESKPHSFCETLEEVAEKFIPNRIRSTAFGSKFEWEPKKERKAFIKGYKLAQETTSSEAIDLFITAINTEFNDQNWDYLEFIKVRVIEQLKNK